MQRDMRSCRARGWLTALACSVTLLVQLIAGLAHANTILGFTLIDATTNQPIAGFDPIAPNATINLTTLPTRSVNIRANVSPATVGSVVMQLNGTTRVENVAPYAQFGDLNNDFLPGALAVGPNTISATPYSGPAASGVRGTALTISVTVIDETAAPVATPAPPPSGLAVTSFTLINADTDQPIAGFDPISSATVNLARLPTRNLNLRANTAGAVGSVKLTFDGSTRIESAAPYALFGDAGGNYAAGNLTVGSHLLVATPYSGPAASGNSGTALTMTLTVEDVGATASPPPPAAPQPIPQPASGMIFPGANWAEASPESQRVDSVKLRQAFSNLARLMPVDETVVIRNGHLIYRGPSIDARHTTWSVTKSFTSTVLGLLIQDGRCTLDTPAAAHVSALGPLYWAVTLRHFATMTSGYDAVGGNYGDAGMDGSSIPFAPTTPLFEPGRKFGYWDDAANQFGNVLTHILRTDTMETYFKTRIADPIGMTNWDWAIPDWPEPDGHQVNDGSGNRLGMMISARDAARFGHLFLNRGRWNSQQLIDAAWVDAATTNQVPTSIEFSGLRGIDGRGTYGFGWVVNGVSAAGARPWPSAPPSTYAARGLNENLIWVIPAWNMVIVRLGTSGLATDAQWNAFLAEVGGALLP